MDEFDRCSELAQQLRVDSVRAAAAAGSGHPTSSMSAAELMAVLLARYLRYDFEQPADPLNDYLIFSKGHASPLLYSLYRAAGAISDEELLSFRKLGSRLEGHPTPRLPWVPVATGSLGIVYLRTTRAATPVLYDADEEFPVGGARVLRAGEHDDATVVAAGITVHEALAAADELAAEGVALRVIDLYSIKPIDERTLLDAAEATGLLVTVEDHHPEGGLGDAVLEVLTVEGARPRIARLAARNMPTSGTPAQLLGQAQIDRHAIADTVRQLVSARAVQA